MTWYSVLAIIILTGFLIINTGLAITNMLLAKVLMQILVDKKGIDAIVTISFKEWFNGFCKNLVPFENLKNFHTVIDNIIEALDIEEL